MKKLRNVGSSMGFSAVSVFVVSALWLSISAVIYGFGFLGVRIDLALNPWLKEVEYSGWTLFFTTRHFPTILYLHNTDAWVQYTIIVALVGGLMISFAAVLAYILRD